MRITSDKSGTVFALKSFPSSMIITIRGDGYLMLLCEYGGLNTSNIKGTCSVKKNLDQVAQISHWWHHTTRNADHSGQEDVCLFSHLFGCFIFSMNFPKCRDSTGKIYSFIRGSVIHLRQSLVLCFEINNVWVNEIYLQLLYPEYILLTPVV